MVFVDLTYMLFDASLQNFAIKYLKPDFRNWNTQTCLLKPSGRILQILVQKVIEKFYFGSLNNIYFVIIYYLTINLIYLSFVCLTTGP